LKSRIVVHPAVYKLHRREKNSSDVLGSDLGITVSVLPANYVKTALFQVKAGTGFSAQLDRHQLDAALETKEVAERSFVLYVDEGRASIRIAKAEGLLTGWPKGQASKTFPTGTWISLTTWVTGWLSCEIGPVSRPSEPDSIESKLRRYKDTPDLAPTLMRDAAHPHAWLLFALQPEGRDIAGDPFIHFNNQPIDH
jgi:hypothetical protein